ncbi:MAG: hypothetical protein QOH97_788 [Actinoplanes sp.]|jgi:hypothetical protein|nr:hypothetical protein [Actinoplanes sp.]
MDLLLELRGVVEAAPAAVATILLDARPGGRSPLAATGVAEPAEGDVFTVTLDGSRMTVAVDRDALMVTLRGEWWYQGVTTVEADDRGSLVAYRIYNVAPGHGWAVRFVSRGPLNAAPGTFAADLADLGAKLSCKAYAI